MIFSKRPAAFLSDIQAIIREPHGDIARMHRCGARRQVLCFLAGWNNDFHGAAHVIATGETAGGRQ